MKQKRFLSLLASALTLALCAALCAAALVQYAQGAARRAASGSALTPVFTRAEAVRWARILAPLALAWLLTAFAAAAFGIQPRKEQPGRAARPLPAPRQTGGWLRRTLYAIALILVALGIYNGGLHDVLVKAINICSECIGLG